jgi:hypothetical protein
MEEREAKRVWKEACEKFFCEIPDPTSRRMMDFYLGVLKDGGWDGEFESEDERKLVKFMIEATSEFEKIKNEVRKRYHENASKQRNDALKAIIKSFTMDEEDFESPNLKNVSTFVSNYMRERGSRPFLYGLYEFLLMQIGKPQICYWDCNDAALTDTGVKNFPSDAARLMCVTLHAKPQDSSSDGTRRWHLNCNLKDSTIQNILAIFPSHREFKELDIRPTGRRGDTAFNRSKDALDVTFPLCCSCCAVS